MLKRFKKQRGFTVIELVTVIWVIVYLAILCGFLYAAVHFIAKFW